MGLHKTNGMFREGTKTGRMDSFRLAGEEQVWKIEGYEIKEADHLEIVV